MVTGDMVMPVLDAHAILPTVASLLCFSFSSLLLHQWRTRRKPYQLVWACGMLWYALAAGADASGQWLGWTEATYRLWYLAGAIGAAAWLGLGEVYLMRATTFGELVALSVFAGSVPALIRGGRLLQAHDDALAGAAIGIGIAGIVAAGILALVCWERPAWLGHVCASLVVAGTAFAAWRILNAPVDTAQMLDPSTGIPHGVAFPESVRMMTPVFNVGGALALLFGAAYSGWQFWRQRASMERVTSTGLIVLGAFVPSLGGSLNRFGMTDLFYWAELLGVLLIFAGFLASSEVFTRRRAGVAQGTVIGYAAAEAAKNRPSTAPQAHAPGRAQQLGRQR
ncbi:MAG: hypothetical protein M3442_14170 [Chloroflexota bacterium]|nr:hypothetical protein [Chloroflexota bacterium]